MKNLYLWRPKSSLVGWDTQTEKGKYKGDFYFPTHFHLKHTAGHVLTGESGELNPFPT